MIVKCICNKMQNVLHSSFNKKHFCSLVIMKIKLHLVLFFYRWS